MNYVCIKVTGLSKLEINYCAKHNQHAKHAKARGIWGMPTHDSIEESRLLAKQVDVFPYLKTGACVLYYKTTTGKIVQ